jgi:hypothetical protein
VLCTHFSALPLFRFPDVCLKTGTGKGMVLFATFCRISLQTCDSVTEIR